MIKSNLYTPQKWPNTSSEECFSENLLETIIKNLS